MIILLETSKKERQRANSAKWRKKNVEKAKLASAKGSFKYKAERYLKKTGIEVTEGAVNEMVEKWMTELKLKC